MKKIFYILIFIGLIQTVKSQDTLLLNNGNIVIGKLSQIDSSEVIFEKFGKKNKTNLKYYDRNEVFSITTKDSISIIYNPSNNSDFEFSVDDMKYYIIGQQDAKKYYKNNWVSVGGFASGLAGGFLIDFYGTGLLVPAIYATVKGAVPCKIDNLPYEKTKLLDKQEYVMGYKNSASKIRTMKAVKSGLLGVLTMVAIRIVAQNIK